MLNQFNRLLQRCTSVVDSFNDRFSSYRLVLYFLLALVGWTVVGSFVHQIPFSWHQIIVSAGLLGAVCWAANKLLAKFLNIPANKESGIISGLILALILTPAASRNDYLILAAAAAVAMASKYILVFRNAHIFNPAAVGAFVAGVIFNYYPSWWVGTKFTTPLIALGAIFILRKVKRYSLALVFLAVYVLALIWTSPSGGTTDAIHHLIWLSLISTSAFFFTSIMLSEPLTSPASLNPTLGYALLVGVLYSFNKLHVSPEEALLIGNLFTFVVAPNRRYRLSFVRKIQEAEGVYSYIFAVPKKFKFKAGQYMEWTLSQHESDSRGNRRYLTISSAPTEPQLMFSVKLPPKPSAFKQHLETLRPNETIWASYLSGSFVLPPDPAKKIVFMAGGVGITPFRSMVKQLVDSGQRRDAVLLYTANKPQELAFRGLIDQASSIGLKSLYAYSIDRDSLVNNVPDYQQRHFYISGPYGFVQAMEKLLLGLQIAPSQIITDYFPGYN